LTRKRKNKDEELNKYFTDKNYRRKKSKKNQTEKLSLRFILYAILISCIILGVYLIYLSQSLPSLSELENPKLEEATKIYSDNGELIDKFYLKNRTKVTIENVPKHFIDALVAIEDRKFYDHWGVDIQRIFQAFIKNVISFDLSKEGASTITQQLAGNLYLDRKEVTISRKLREAMTAIQIEKTYTKQEILAYYLNTVYFGKGAYGVEAAAQIYFDKNAKDLNLDESAILVGLLKSPANYDPVYNPEACKERRNTVLNSMYEMDFITKEEYEVAANDPIKVNVKTEVSYSDSKAPEFTEYVRQILQVKAEKFGFDLYRDGLKVYTTLDTRFQNHAEDAVKEQLKIHQKSFNKFWSWKNKDNILNSALDRYIKETEEYKKCNTEAERKKIYNSLKNNKSIIDSVKKLTTTIQVGFVVIDPKTGEIKAMVGANPNTRFKYGLNHVTQIKRQPGSSFKPFVYTVAIQNGYSPGFMISNDPLKIHDRGRMRLLRGGGQGGNVSLRYALAKSINVVAVRTAMEIAPIDKVIDLVHNMGINSELPSYPILALGVGEVSPLEMTNAFGTFANEGIWVEPIAIKRIEDRNGNVIEEIIPETKEVLSEGVAYIISDMLEDVIDYGTGTSVRRFFHRPAAGKTGTSQNYTDSWFVGYTPQYVAGVWLGFDDARIKFGGAYGQGGRAAAPIWGRFMKYLYSDDEFDFPIAYFLMPDDVDEVAICMVTGLLSSGSCPAEYELVLKKYMPRKCTIGHTFFDSLETAVESLGLPPEGNLEPPED